MKRALIVLAAAILSALLLWRLSVLVDPGRIASDLAGARPAALLGAVFVFALVQWLRAWRFSAFTLGRWSLPKSPYFSVALRLNLLNYVVPFRLGELGYPMMLKLEAGQPVAVSAGVLVLARIYDLAVVGGILLGFGAWAGIFGSLADPWLLIVLAVLMQALPPIAARLAARLIPLLEGRERLALTARRLHLAADNLGSSTALWLAGLISAAIWLAYGAGVMMAASAVVPALPPASVMAGAAAGNIAFALPVNGIAGLGPSQAAFAYVATRAGIEAHPAIVAAFASYVASLASAVLFGCAAFLARARQARVAAD